MVAACTVCAGIGPFRGLRHRRFRRYRRKRIHEGSLPAGLSQNVQKSFWHDLRGMSFGDLEVNCSMCKHFQ